MRFAKLRLLGFLVLLLGVACAGQTGAEVTEAPPAGAGSFEGETLRVGAFSQQIADLMMEGFGDEFEADTGAEVEWVVAATDVNVSRILASPNDPELDTMLVSNHDVWPLQDAGLVVEPDYGSMSNIENVDESARLSTGPGLWYFDLGFCYNTEAYEENGIEPPSSIDDLWDPALAGRVALPDSTSGFFNTLMTPIAEHYDMPTDDPGPLVERFSEIEPYGFFNSNTDATNLWQSGDAWAGIFSGRCLVWQSDGLPFELAPLNLEIDGQTYPYFGYVLAISNIEGGNSELGEVFMNYAISEGGIWPYMDEISGAFSPTVISIRERLLEDPEIAPRIYQNPSQEIYLPDYADFWQAKAEWVNAWNREVQQ